MRRPIKITICSLLIIIHNESETRYYHFLSYHCFYFVSELSLIMSCGGGILVALVAVHCRMCSFFPYLVISNFHSWKMSNYLFVYYSIGSLFVKLCIHLTRTIQFCWHLQSSYLFGGLSSLTHFPKIFPPITPLHFSTRIIRTFQLKKLTERYSFVPTDRF